MTLDDLKASAPRSFDKTLIELLVLIQSGQQPIVVHEPTPLVPVGRDMSPAIQRVAEILDDIEADRAADKQRIARLEAVIARLAFEAAQEPVE